MGFDSYVLFGTTDVRAFIEYSVECRLRRSVIASSINSPIGWFLLSFYTSISPVVFSNTRRRLNLSSKPILPIGSV